jgi:hypothetical protein
MSIKDDMKCNNGSICAVHKSRKKAEKQNGLVSDRGQKTKIIK